MIIFAPPARSEKTANNGNPCWLGLTKKYKETPNKPPQKVATE
jgi:hypothetical protein